MLFLNERFLCMKNISIISLKKRMNFTYLLRGAPTVPTARSNRCFAVATPFAQRKSQEGARYNPVASRDRGGAPDTS